MLLQIQILSSKMGQVLKAAEKLTELQTNAFQGQSSRKQNAQPNKSNQQGRYQQSGSDQASRKRKDSEHQFARKASSNKNKKGKQLTFKKGGISLEDDSSDDQPEYAYLGQLRVSPAVHDLAGTKSMREEMEPQPMFSWNGEEVVQELYLHGKPPSLEQTIAQFVPVLKVSDNEYVYRQVPYKDDSTSRDQPSFRASSTMKTTTQH